MRASAICLLGLSVGALVGTARVAFGGCLPCDPPISAWLEVRSAGGTWAQSAQVCPGEAVYYNLTKWDADSTEGECGNLADSVVIQQWYLDGQPVASPPASFDWPGTYHVTVRVDDSGTQYGCPDEAEGPVTSNQVTVCVTGVNLQRNSSLSGNDDLPNSEPFTTWYGGPPSIGGPQDATVEIQGEPTVLKTCVVELQGTVNNTCWAPSLSRFAACQHYIWTVTQKFDNAPDEVDTLEGDECMQDFRLDRDGEGDGHTYFILDNPGPSKEGVEALFDEKRHLTSVISKYEFATYGTCGGQNAASDGQSLTWEVTITATRQAGSIVWSVQ